MNYQLSNRSGHRYWVLPLFFFSIFSIACSNGGTPKPKGYPRIELQEDKGYERVYKGCPFSFEIPEDAVMTKKTVRDDPEHDTKCWYDIVYPRYKAQIHLTYKHVDGDLRKYVSHSHKLAYKHQVKARNIIPSQIRNDSSDVYGTKYRIEGNVASNLQFFVTDSTEHFLRGSLYFMTEPNADSLRPLIDHIDQDIEHMLGTFRWEESS